MSCTCSTHVALPSLPFPSLPARPMPSNSHPHLLPSYPQVEAAWRLLQLMWQGSGEGAWRALRAYPWSGALATLVEALYDKLRNQQLKLVEAAYSTIAPARLAALCGCGEEEALALAQAKGWRAAAGGAEGQPAVVEVVPARGVRGELDSLECLVHLSEYMMQLEEPV